MRGFYIYELDCINEKNSFVNMNVSKVNKKRTIEVALFNYVNSCW